MRFTHYLKKIDPWVACYLGFVLLLNWLYYRLMSLPEHFDTHEQEPMNQFGHLHWQAIGSRDLSEDSRAEGRGGNVNQTTRTREQEIRRDQMTAAVNEQPTWSPFRGPWLIKLFLMKANNFNIHSVILSNHNSDDFWAGPCTKMQHVASKHIGETDDNKQTNKQTMCITATKQYFYWTLLSTSYYS